MARATRVNFPGAWYHVLNRGTERRVIFRSTRCYEKFIELLSSLPERFGVRLRGYALMGNHSNWRAEKRTLAKRSIGLGFETIPLELIHHNAVGTAIRRFTQRLQSDRPSLKGLACPKGARASLTTARLSCRKTRVSLPISHMRKSALIVPPASNRFSRWAEY